MHQCGAFSDTSDLCTRVWSYTFANTNFDKGSQFTRNQCTNHVAAAVFTDVTSVTMYGKLRHTWEVQQEQQVLSDQGFFDDVTLSDETVTSHKSLKQMTSISKLNVIPSAGMKQLWVEGNRIKVETR